jgi:transcription antitermination factor NusG
MAKPAPPKPANQLHATDLRWFAVHTRFKCEKYVVDQLQKKGINGYVPLRTQLKVYGTRKRKTELPVISCYAFVQIVESEYVRVLETENVLAFVRSAKSLMAIPEQEMLNLKRIAMDETLDWSVSAELIREGQQVTVTAGTLAGMKGLVVRLDGKDKFVVELETIGHSILVSMDSKYFKVAE